MPTIAVIDHSTYGHTKLQAEAVLRGAQGVPNVTAKLYTAEEATALLDELDAADAITVKGRRLERIVEALDRGTLGTTMRRRRPAER